MNDQVRMSRTPADSEVDRPQISDALPAPAVSVVIATYNYAQYIGGAIESVMRQSFHDFEVVIVDDGSTDNTAAEVAPYLGDHRLHYYALEHRGQPCAKNAGILRTKGEYIAFLDADDRWSPDKLERQMELFSKDRELGVVYARRQLIDPLGHRLPTPQLPLYRGWVLDRMFYDNFVCFPSCIVRREVFENVGLFDESLQIGIDYDLWLRVARKYRFDYVDAPLVEYRTGHANLSSRKVERLHVALGIMNRFLADGEARSRVDRTTISRAYASTYGHLGYFARESSRRLALGYYLAALKYRPWDAATWYQLASLPIPEPLRRVVRSVKRAYPA